MYVNFLEVTFSLNGVGFANSSGLGYMYSVHPSPLIGNIDVFLDDKFSITVLKSNKVFPPLPDAAGE